MREVFGIVSVVLLVTVSPRAFGAMSCPQMPAAVTEVSRDVRTDITASAGSLGKARIGELQVKTETEAKNLFDKYPNVDKLLTLQMMTATYCQMLNSASGVSDDEKLERWERYQDKVLQLQPSRAHSGLPGVVEAQWAFSLQPPSGWSNIRCDCFVPSILPPIPFPEKAIIEIPNKCSSPITLFISKVMRSSPPGMTMGSHLSVPAQSVLKADLGGASTFALYLKECPR